MPYLHYDTYVSMIKRRNLVKRRLRHGRSRPTPKDVADNDSLEARVLWRFLAYDPPLNPRRTLDQYGYPSLQDTFARDDDQMLYKLTKVEGSNLIRRPLPVTSGLEESIHSSRVDKSSIPGMPARKRTMTMETTKPVDDDESDIEIEEVDYKNGNVLMVDQLWLWAIDTSEWTVITPRESNPLTLQSHFSDLLP
jgi:hypothetical protein